MRKPITYLNVTLLLVAVWVAASIRTTWRRNHARYAVFAASSATAPRAGVAGASGAQAGSQPLSPPSYSELVTQNLFSPDRNNEQPVWNVKQPPALPIVIGTVNLSDGVVALMAEQKHAGRGTFRRLKVGEEIGGYRVAEIAEHKVVIEFAGQKTTIDVYESAESVRAAAAVISGSPTGPAGTSSQVMTAVPAAGTAPSETAGPGATPPDSGAAAGAPATVHSTSDPFLTYTVEGNRKKFSRVTPFGVQTWYEEIRPAPKPQ